MAGENIFARDKKKMDLYNSLKNANENSKIDANLFNFDIKESEFEKNGLRYVDVSTLKPFKNHIFKLYEGERYEDMKVSIEKNGILTPIIIRQVKEDINIVDSEFEILSGHNRVKAAIDLGIRRIPAIIKYNLPDEEALVYVIETNLLQRSFSEMSHSEKAIIIKSRYENIFSQGKRNDIKNELISIESAGKTDEKSTSSPMETGLRTDEKIGSEYSLNRSNVARYLRIAKLVQSLMEKVDTGEIPFRAGVDLSFLNDEDQENLNAVITEYSYKINLKNAIELREVSRSRDKLSKDYIIQILDGKKKIKKTKTTITLNQKTIKEYFSKEDSIEVIQKEIMKSINFTKNIIPQKISKYLSDEEISKIDLEKFIISLIDEKYGSKQ